MDHGKIIMYVILSSPLAIRNQTTSKGGLTQFIFNLKWLNTFHVDTSNLNQYAFICVIFAMQTSLYAMS